MTNSERNAISDIVDAAYQRDHTRQQQDARQIARNLGTNMHTPGVAILRDAGCVCDAMMSTRNGRMNHV